MARLDSEIIALGDWQQPAEDRYRLSRGMLEAALDLVFPVLIVERSPLLARDLDLLVEINQHSWVGIVFSISNVDADLKHAFEPRSPGIKRRLHAMQRLAQAGLLVGTSLMPIIPHAGDDERHLEEAILATRDAGGSFILAGGLTMEAEQAERTLAAARRLDSRLEEDWRRLYGWKQGGKPNYSPRRAYSARLGLMVRDLCTRHGLLDCMPRYIKPGALAMNKRIAEKLFLKTYDLQLEQANDYRIWAYRKAAWMVDGLPESILDRYHARGENGLKELPGLGAVSRKRSPAGWKTIRLIRKENTNWHCRG